MYEKVLIKCVYFYCGDIWRLASELKNSFFLLCDVIIIVLVLGPKTRWSIEISLPTFAMVVSSLVIEALWFIYSDKTALTPTISIFTCRIVWTWKILAITFDSFFFFLLIYYSIIFLSSFPFPVWHFWLYKFFSLKSKFINTFNCHCWINQW